MLPCRAKVSTDTPGRKPRSSLHRRCQRPAMSRHRDAAVLCWRLSAKAETSSSRVIPHYFAVAYYTHAEPRPRGLRLPRTTVLCSL
eukprot:3754365-Prymnesium_polylepis.1